MLFNKFDCPVWGCFSEIKVDFGTMHPWEYFNGDYYCPKHDREITEIKRKIAEMIHELNFPTKAT